jgi:hypothetical protein
VQRTGARLFADRHERGLHTLVRLVAQQLRLLMQLDD